MAPELEFRRRALIVFYRKYIEADDAWRLARKEALSWFPLDGRATVPLMGDSGSHLRRLYDRRDRTLSQFKAIYREIEQARRRALRKAQTLALPSR